MTNEALGPRGASAGAVLRAARERQGLHIAALAAAIKVSPRKLEALENDRFDELPGATFTRALAQTVCRTLRIDAAPVLALLPPSDMVELDHVTGRLNAPFRDRASRDGAGLSGITAAPLAWGGVLLLVAALVTYFVPPSWYGPAASAPAARPAPSVVPVARPAPATAAPAPTAAPLAAEPAASAAEAAASGAVPAVAAPTAAAPASATQVEITHATPGPADAASAAGSGILQLAASDASWIEVRDSGGRILLSRTVQPGEAVGLDGALPMRLVIGNAPATRVTFRGRSVDLAPSTRDTVARIELN
jgi:cytoskeleton protein RodZ